MASRSTLRAYLSPGPLAAFALGVSSGFPLTLLLGTMTLWLSRVGISKKTVGFAVALTAPYTFKWLWAPLLDRVRVPGLSRVLGHRRSWLLPVQLLLLGGVVALGFSDPVQHIGRFAAAAVALAFLSATQDILIDAFRIELLQPEQLDAGTAMNQIGYRVGNLAAGAGTIWLASGEGGRFGWPLAYAVTALLVLPGMVAALLIGPGRGMAATAAADARTAAEWLRGTIVAPLWDFLRRPGAVLILGYIIVYKFGDAFGQIMLSPMLVEQGYSDTAIITANKLVGFWAVIAGSAVAAPIIARMGMYRALIASSGLYVLANIGFALLAAHGRSDAGLAAAVGFENLASGIGLTVFATWLSGMSNLAYTATQYALLSSFAALARTFLSAPSGYAAAWLGWPGFFLMAAALSVPGALIMLWLWRRGWTGNVIGDRSVQSA